MLKSPLTLMLMVGLNVNETLWEDWKDSAETGDILIKHSAVAITAIGANLCVIFMIFPSLIAFYIILAVPYLV